MATGSVSPKTGKIVNIPDQTVTIGTATDGGTGTTVSVPFTVGSVTTGGPVTYFTATSTPGSFTANGSTSPITVSGLSTGTAYTFKVKAGNPSGYSTAGESAASNSVTPAVPPAFESIATATGSGATSITFSSIPNTYTSLQLRIIGKDVSPNGGLRAAELTFNGSTGGYSYHSVFGTPTLSTGGGGPASVIDTPNFTYDSYLSSSIVGSCIIDIIDYANTSKGKTIRMFAGADQNGTSVGNRITFSSGSTSSTAAISSLKLTTYGDGWATNCRIALYGIKG